MTRIPDLVRLSKLDTQFYSDPEYVQHVRYISGSTLRERKIRKEERWKRERWLGRGSFGTVELERCIHGESEGKVRAVKKIQKLESGDYYRELEAIALFSHSNYERCFVKSFGWYDDNNSVFITMEYLPYSDLHKYLSSSLPEKEGQHIVSQILEGLNFMHDNGFAHRDLKPANIMVVSKGPDWYVKITDFGISKRAVEGHTVLHTLTGTAAFTAPEVFGFVQRDNRSNSSYTNAVDIWSLGVLTFLMLTGETLFKDPYRLCQYVGGSFKFPLDFLCKNEVSEQGRVFIRSLMAPKPEDRPEAKECLEHPWLDYLIEDAPHETQRNHNIPNSSPIPIDSFNDKPSANWSTQDQIPAHETHSLTGVPTERETPVFKEEISLPTSEPVLRIYWKRGKRLKGHSEAVCAVVFSPDGKQIVSASADKTIRLWDSAIGIEYNILKGHSEAVYAVAFSPDGKKIASASGDKTIRVWDSATGVECNIFKGHSGRISAVAFSPDGKKIASTLGDKTIRVWDSATGVECNILRGHSDYIWAIAFSPDGKQIASASALGDKTIRLWDLATGVEYNILRGHSGDIWAIAFSPDGKQIISVSHDRTIRFWDSATGVECNIFRGHSDYIWAIVFSPDGKQIASASTDKTIQLWDSVTDNLTDFKRLKKLSK